MKQQFPVTERDRSSKMSDLVKASNVHELQKTKKKELDCCFVSFRLYPCVFQKHQNCIPSEIKNQNRNVSKQPFEESSLVCQYFRRRFGGRRWWSEWFRWSLLWAFGKKLWNSWQRLPAGRDLETIIIPISSHAFEEFRLSPGGNRFLGESQWWLDTQNVLDVMRNVAKIARFQKPLKNGVLGHCKMCFRRKRNQRSRGCSNRME